jgi:anti-sigma28 factor (negative regulator of flagellin synthesis)
VRIGEIYSYLPESNIRSAIPAKAKELIPAHSESLDADSVSGVGVTGSEDRERRVAELRRQVQDGTYNVDATEVASKLIDTHLDS